MENDDKITKISKNVIKKSNVLLENLKKDENLNKKENKDLKMSYLSLCQLFMDNFGENLNKTSIEMNEEYPLGVDTWKDFLNYPIVRKYIQSYKDEKITKVADKGLMDGDKNAVGIKKVMQDRAPAINNSNIILIRVPERIDVE